MKINFDNVSFRYTNKINVLSNVSLNLNKNEIIFILGASGSGKSTLVNHMNGLLFASEGNVTLSDQEGIYKLNRKFKNIKHVRKNVGLVFQIPENQIFENTVLKEVMFGPINFKESEEEAKRASVLSLELMGMREEFHEKSPFKLSGGEKRKVAIASVLACKPRVLIFDEPTSSLDSKSVNEFFKMVSDLKSRGNTIIIVSHNSDLAYEYGDRIIILDSGRIIYDGDYNSAFNNVDLLSIAKIDVPFVVKMKNKFNINEECRTIKELANLIRGDTL